MIDAEALERRGFMSEGQTGIEQKLFSWKGWEYEFGESDFVFSECVLKVDIGSHQPR